MVTYLILLGNCNRYMEFPETKSHIKCKKVQMSDLHWIPQGPKRTSPSPWSPLGGLQGRSGLTLQRETSGVVRGP